MARSSFGIVILVCCALFLPRPVHCQSTNASISGRVGDPAGASVPAAKIRAENVNTGISYSTETNDAGFYEVGVPPGKYRVIISKDGFALVVKPDVELHVQDQVGLNFALQVGSVQQSVTVESGLPLVDTESAAVSTVVDRQFVENLPMNGRSFQSLVELTPGVVLTPSTPSDNGQFSVNGQRASSNYWMVDGVSANVGVGTSSFGTTTSPANGTGGALMAFSVQGGTNSLVSIDALQEFRIQTSSYAPEFGRTPGAQISILTRSGTNQFHGSLFDYLRNDVLDANDWFANNKNLPKPKERQNDFGATLGGPVVRNRTFFFFSYEGLRLRLPQVALTTVPSLSARQSAVPPAQPFLNAFPKPNGANTGADQAQFNASYSNSSTLDASSIRVDHKFTDRLSVFGRYNYAPSELTRRGNGNALSVVSPARILTQTATIGVTYSITPRILNDVRVNYSHNSTSGHSYIDDFGSAVPPSVASLLPQPFIEQNSIIALIVSSLTSGNIVIGEQTRNVQRQWNLVDNVPLQVARHEVKLGVDFRRLRPLFAPALYTQLDFFSNPTSMGSGSLLFSQPGAQQRADLRLQNVGVYAQDTWRATPRFVLTYGLRWDVDSAPTNASGAPLVAVTGFGNASALAPASPGSPVFSTRFGNVAPRVGASYQVSQHQGWQTVVRGGFGVFYDLATTEVGAALGSFYPFSASTFVFGGTFPLSPAAATPPQLSADVVKTAGLFSFDPALNLPYALEWNTALEQGLGIERSLTLSYVGSAGRRLLQTQYLNKPNPNIAFAELVSNAGSSDYDALQVAFRQRLSHGLQVLASYDWAHSIDTGSASSLGSVSNYFSPELGANENRGPSDFDVRHAFSVGITYDLPGWKPARVVEAATRGWSIQSIVQARSSPPVDVYLSSLSLTSTLGQNLAAIRPDAAPGIPLYLYGPQYPGGKILNNTLNQAGIGCKGPFCPPPKGPTGTTLRQGNLGRNSLRAFPAAQWDFAVHRDFAVNEALHLQFRAEMFNVLNHPNFGSPAGNFNLTTFGRAIQMLGQSLAGNVSGSGGLSSLYQIGGPRSIQFALKILF